MNLNEYAEELIQELENTSADLGRAIIEGTDTLKEASEMNQASDELHDFIEYLIKNQKKK